MMIAPISAGLMIAFWITLSRKAKSERIGAPTISFYYGLFAFFALSGLRSSGLTETSSIQEIWALASEPKFIIPMTAYSILVCILPNILFYRGSQSATALTAGLILLLEPVVATLSSSFLWHTNLPPLFAFGAGLVLFSGAPLEELPFLTKKIKLRSFKVGAATANLAEINRDFVSVAAPWMSQWEAIEADLSKLRCTSATTLGFFDPSDYLSRQFRGRFEEKFGRKNSFSFNDFELESKKLSLKKPCLFVAVNFSKAQAPLARMAVARLSQFTGPLSRELAVGEITVASSMFGDFKKAIEDWENSSHLEMSLTPPELTSSKSAGVCEASMWGANVFAPVSFAGRRVAVIQGQVTYFPTLPLIGFAVFVIGSIVWGVRSWAVKLIEQIESLIIEPIKQISRGEEI